MDRCTIPGLSLPAEVLSVIWRIVGNAEHPLNRETTRRLIERTIRKYARDVPSAIQDRAIDEVTGWFDFHGDKGWLKEDVRKVVGTLIAGGVKDALSSQSGIQNHETAFCALGSIDPEIAANVIGSSWSSEELDVFVDYSFSTLKTLCDKDAVINPERVMHLGIANAKASLNDERSEGRLETLWQLRDCDWWLYSSVANMVELLLKLNPDHFYSLVDRIEHPVINLRAARCVTDLYAHSDHRVPLQWLVDKPADNMVALTIVHILDSVNSLDSDLRWRSEGDGKQGDIDTKASCLLSGLIDRLSKLEPMSCARWVCELLNYGIFALNAQGQSEKPPRVQELEELCTHQLKRLVQQSWSEELLDTLRDGLCLTPLTPRILPLVQVALEIREEQPAHSAEITRLIIDTQEEQIADALRGNDRFYYNLEFWTNRDWVSGLALALVLFDGDIDLPEWVSQKCQVLPLSAWDAEEDFQRFLEGDKLAQFRFLVALHAVQLLTDVGRPEDPAAVLTLAEDMWTHCQFVGQYMKWELPGSNVAEYAARVAIALGQPSDEWLLDQASNAGVGPQTLWAMIGQEMPDGTRGINFPDDRHSPVVAEFRRVASDRFGNMRGLDLTELSYLGKFWLLLEAVDEAEETAMTIVSFPERKLKRGHRVIALNLLAFAASKRRLAPEAEKRVALLYNQLWSSYSTLIEERDERRRIDDLLAAAQEDFNWSLSRDDVT